MGNEDLKNLKNEYKKAKKNASSRAEKKEIKKDFKDMKDRFKELARLSKEYKLDETPEEFWERQNIPTFDEFMKNKENGKED